MRSNFKPIGELVTKIDERNTNGEATELIGVSIDKCFIKSVANTIGTDLTKYKIIRKDDFAVSLMQVSRDSKIPVARLTEYDIAMMSPAYPIFRVTDKNVILPEYLDMWFKRTEFDREAAFIAVGGVRGSMPWDEFAQMEVHVPDIEVQRKIVRDYQIIEDRIALKKKINDNLSENLYTEFMREFYSSKQATLSGDPPAGWKLLPLSEAAEFQYGKMVPESERKDSGYPIFSGYGVTGYYHEYMFEDPHIVVLARGVSGTGEVRISPPKSYITNLSIALTLKDNSFFAYLYEYLANDNLRSLDSGSAQSMITIDNLGRHKVALPPKKEAEKFNSYAKTILDMIDDNRYEMDLLDTLLKVQLTRLSSR